MIVFSIVVCVCLLFSSSFGSSNIGEKDLSLHSYTPDGKVEQLAFASRAIDKGPPRISFRDRDTGLITSFAMSDLPSRLCDKVKPSIHVDPEISVAYTTAGYGPDVSHLLNHLNNMVQTHCNTYGEAPNLDYIAYHTSSWITRGMYKQDNEDKLSRPLAVAASIAAYDRVYKRNRLVLVDNSGFTSDTDMLLLGRFSDTDRDVIAAALTSPTPPQLHKPSRNSKHSKISSWLHKCHTCLSTLMKEEDAEYATQVVDCCILDARGSVHRTFRPLRTVDETVAWIKHTAHDDKFAVNDNK